MGADSTLVNAAFKEAASRAGAKVPDLKPLYDSTVDIGKNAFQRITDAIKARDTRNEKIRLGKESQLKRFKNVMERNYQSLFENEETMPQKVVDAIDERIRELQDEFEAVNTYGKNDTVENERARMRINGELKRVINEYRGKSLKAPEPVEVIEEEDRSEIEVPKRKTFTSRLSQPQTPPLPQTPMPGAIRTANANVINPLSGLTRTESALLSPEEQIIARRT